DLLDSAQRHTRGRPRKFLIAGSNPAHGACRSVFHRGAGSRSDSAYQNGEPPRSAQSVRHQRPRLKLILDVRPHRRYARASTCRKEHPMIGKHAKFVGAVVFAGALVMALGSLGGAQTPVPGMGSWKLNVAKSKFTPGPSPKSSTVTFTAAGQGVKAVIDTVGADGAKIHWEYTADFDAKPQPVTGKPAGDLVLPEVINHT